MKIGDKVRIRTGKRGMPPVGELVEFVTGGDPEGTRYHAARVKRRMVGGAVIEVYPLEMLTPCGYINATIDSPEVADAKNLAASAMMDRVANEEVPSATPESA